MATFVDGMNPTDHMTVIQNPDGEGYVIGVRRYCECGSPCCDHREVEVTPHTGGRVFAESDDAYEYIECLRESWDQQYEDYLDENRYEIAQMERYEMWRREQ